MDAFAQKSGLSKAYISILERNVNPVNGKPVIPSLETIKAVSQAIGADFNDVIAMLDGNQKVILHSEAPSIPPGFIPMPEMMQVPLIGSIACGTPILAEQNIKSYIGVPAAWRADFALECHGDSMAPTICDGDVVCIRKQPEVEQGQIAAVRIGEEATLKHFYYQNDVMTLLADNPSVCPPMVYTGPQLEEVEVEGLAVGFCRGLV
ncbi:LexA repressor [Faecalibacterium prausnitzii]|nr:LexA repressor [Faecalibacterium prausnitzii]